MSNTSNTGSTGKSFNVGILLNPRFFRFINKTYLAIRRKKTFFEKKNYWSCDKIMVKNLA